MKRKCTIKLLLVSPPELDFGIWGPIFRTYKFKVVEHYQRSKIKIVLPYNPCKSIVVFLSSGLGASMSHLIDRSVGWPVCQKSVKNMSKTVKKEVSRLLRCLQVYRSTLLAYDKLFCRWNLL